MRITRREVLLFLMTGAGCGLITNRTNALDPMEFWRNGTWPFVNFSTANLAWDTFTEAFRLQWYDYLNPITYLLFAIGQGTLADGGNCFGMSLLAAEIERRGGFESHYYGNLQHPIRGLPSDPNFMRRLRGDINIYHWRQMSAHFLHRWIGSAIDSLHSIVENIERDLRSEQFGVLCITKGASAHSMVPVRVEHVSGSLEAVIYVYDPNRPRPLSSGPPMSPIPVPILAEGGVVMIDRGYRSWRFVMADNDIYSSQEGLLTYVPTSSDPDWRKLANDPLAIVLGEGAKVQQITDAKGRHLYTKPGASTPSGTDFSVQGLGRDVVRLVPIEGTPRPAIDVNPVPQLQMSQDKLVSAMRKKYEGQYGKDCELYFVLNPMLKGLKIQVKSTAPKRGVKLMLGGPDKSLEMNLVAPVPEHVVSLNTVGNLADGVRVWNDHIADMAFSTIQHDRKQLLVQHLPDAVSAPYVEFGLTEGTGNLTVKASKLSNYLQLRRRSIDLDGQEQSLGDMRVNVQNLGTVTNE